MPLIPAKHPRASARSPIPAPVAPRCRGCLPSFFSPRHASSLDPQPFPPSLIGISAPRAFLCGKKNNLCGCRMGRASEAKLLVGDRGTRRHGKCLRGIAQIAPASGVAVPARPLRKYTPRLRKRKLHPPGIPRYGCGIAARQGRASFPQMVVRFPLSAFNFQLFSDGPPASPAVVAQVA
jgi:hypothetical protein